MNSEVVLVAFSFLLMIVELAVLIALLFRTGDTPKNSRKVSSDLKKIKDQINGE